MWQTYRYITVTWVHYNSMEGNKTRLENHITEKQGNVDEHVSDRYSWVILRSSMNRNICLGNGQLGQLSLLDLALHLA